jgi:hypothetical protein
MNLAPGVVVPIPTLPLSFTLRAGFIGAVPSLSTLKAGAPASPTTISLAPGVAVPTPTFCAVAELIENKLKDKANVAVLKKFTNFIFIILSYLFDKVASSLHHQNYIVYFRIHVT